MWVEVGPVFFWQFLCYSQSGDDPQEDLIKFGYKLNMKEIFIDKTLLYFWLPTRTMYRNLENSLKFWSNYAYWKTQKAHDISTLKNFNIAFWLYIASRKKKAELNCNLGFAL
jgi:hypothetical protein